MKDGDKVQFTNLVTKERMEGKLVGGADTKYVTVYAEEKKAYFAALASEITVVIGERE